MLLGDVAAYDQHAADAVILVDRAVAIGPPDLLEPAMPRHRHELLLMPGGTPAAHDLLDLRTDDRPDFGPAVAAALAERARMPLRAHGLAIGVVIELDQLRTPPDEHRVVGIEQDANGGPKALRPAVRRPDRSGRPVERARQLTHFPAAGEEIRSIRSVEIQHSGQLGQPGRTQPELPACHGSANVPTLVLVPINFREL